MGGGERRGKLGDDNRVINLTIPDKPELGAALGGGNRRGNLSYDWRLAQIRVVIDEWFLWYMSEDAGVEEEMVEGNKRGREEIREEEGGGGEIRGDKFRNERYRCKKPNLVSPKEWMPMKDAGTQLA